MADEVATLSGKLGIDTTDFKTALGAANRELRVLESGFKASAAALGDWTQDATGLESRVKSLTNQIDIQSAKVDALRAEHLRLVEANGANSRAAQDAEIKLNKETETLNKMQNELQGTEKKLSAVTEGEEDTGEAAEDMGEKVEESGSKMETFKGILSGVGTIAGGLVTAVAAVGAAAVAAVAGVGALVLKTVEASGELVDMSTKTGISTTRLQELDYVGGQLGTSLDTITGAQSRLIRSMESAQEQTGKFNDKLKEAQESSWDKLEEGDVVLGDVAATFKRLGISVTDSSGKLRDSEQVFADALNAIGKIENPVEADAIAMSIFGKSAQELNPLIKAGADEMARLAAEAHDVGAVMSDENVSAFEAVGDTIASLKAGLTGITGTLLSTFLPGIQDVLGQAGGYMDTFKQIVDSSGGDIGKVAEGVGGLLGKIVTDIAGQLPKLVKVGTDIIQSILKAIVTALPTLIPAAVGIITSLINFIVENLPLLVDAAIELVMALVNGILPQLPMLVEAALQIIITLANGITEMLPNLIPAIVDVLVKIIDTLIENLPLLVDAALKLIIALAQGLIIALPKLIEKVPVLVTSLLNALLKTYPLWMNAAGEIIGTLATGIILNIPVAIGAIAEVIVGIGTTLGDFISYDLPEMGASFIYGLIEGIENAAGFLYDAIAAIILQMIATIQSELGISSPSKVGRGIGKNLFQSQALGALDALQGVEQTFAFATRRLALAADGGKSGGGVRPSAYDQSVHESYTFWGPVNVAGGAGATLSKSIKGRRF